MKMSFWSLLIICSFVAISCAGCADDSGPKSVAEDVEVSELEAYEQALRDMEAEDADAMEMEDNE